MTPPLTPIHPVVAWPQRDRGTALREARRSRPEHLSQTAAAALLGLTPREYTLLEGGLLTLSAEDWARALDRAHRSGDSSRCGIRRALRAAHAAPHAHASAATPRSADRAKRLRGRVVRLGDGCRVASGRTSSTRRRGPRARRGCASRDEDREQAPHRARGHRLAARALAASDRARRGRVRDAVRSVDERSPRPARRVSLRRLRRRRMREAPRVRQRRVQGP